MGATVSPLLDMASCIGMPELQAESAAGLADVAQDVNAAMSLCTADAFEQLKKLLQSDHMEVTYPTARTLLLLEATGYLELLPLIVNKVQAAWSSPMVQRCGCNVLLFC